MVGRRFFAVGIVAIGAIMGFCYSDASAILGDTATISGGEWNICISTGTSYTGSSFVANVTNEGFVSQLIFSDFYSEGCKAVKLAAGNYSVTMNKPMGVSSMEYTIAGNKLTFVTAPVSKYMNNFGEYRNTVGASKIEIRFDANGGTGSMAPISNLVPGASAILTNNSFMRQDYDFIGWNTEADGSGESYADGDTISFEHGGTKRLYAQWQEKPFAMLAMGSIVNAKMKKLAGSTGSVSTGTENTKIKAIKTAETLPTDFNETDEKYIISDASSPIKIHAWFDNTNSRGIIYVYTSADVINGGMDMAYMFTKMTNLADISGVSSWNTSRATKMNSMFSSDSKLLDLSALSEWNTSNVTNMSYMFRETRIASFDSLEAKQYPGKDYVSWDTSKVTNMFHMFYSNTNLSDISALGSWNVSNVSDMHEIFRGDSRLIDISALANWDTRSLNNAQGMFYSTGITDVSALETKQHPGNDYVSWDTSRITNMSTMFYNAKIEDISALASWNTSNVNNMSTMFAGTKISNVDALATRQYPGKNYVSWDISKVQGLSNMFKSASYLEDISALASWNTSNVASANNLFSGNTSLSDISALAYWDTSNMYQMDYMFDGDSSLEDISALASWDTSKVTKMDRMFEGTGITNTDALKTEQHIGNDYVSWDVSKVKSMSYMFSNTSNLFDVLALSSWNVSAVTDMQYMFQNVLNVSDFSPLNNWSLNSSLNKANMFKNVPSTTILPNWYQ